MPVSFPNSAEGGKVQQTNRNTRHSKRMKLALNTVTIQPAPLFDKIVAASKVGFEGIEFHVYEIFDYLIDGGTLSDLKLIIADAGLEIPSMLGFRNWGDLRGHDYQIHLHEARLRLRLCANLGCPHLVCSTPMYQSDWSNLHERYTDLLEIGREEGCTPAFEFIGHYASITNLADAETMLSRTGHPDACHCLDAFHLWNGGSAREDFKAVPADSIAHFHIDDASPDKPQGQQDDGDRVMPGDGQIDLSNMLSVLREKGYDKWLSLELFDRDLREKPPTEVAREGYEKIALLLH